jgi:DNA modification methylase
MGSGSTGVACKQTDRDFIGIEIDEKYFNIAKDRIEEKLKENDKQLNIFDMLGDDINE